MKVIFTGPDPRSANRAHAGGQLTATTGFARFAEERGIEIEWVDTLQSNFPVPSLSSRILRAAGRLVRFTGLALRSEADGAILFAGAGMSFVERSLMALVARIAGVPVLLMIRDGNFRLAYDRSVAFRRFVRLMLSVPDRVGVQGDSWRPLLRDAGVPSERVVVVPNWLDRPPLSPARPPSSGDLRLVFVGWLTAGKGVPELLGAMRILGERNVTAKLTIVGGGDLLEECRAQADAPEARGSIEVTGWLSADEVGAVLARSDVLVLPSHAEGFPNVVMEALSYGLPVIATPVGAVPDSVIDGRNGAIITVGDAQAIAAAVERYVADRSMVQVQSKHALEAARSLHDLSVNCGKLIAALGLEAD
ncbi:glycosyltransferase family 4 protein [Tsuneonella sp. YG55]|uniref:Glycosyltransferase family 4 protein n=1 Tax=Tsuneonella litorea TaxID=2976475 RepID=A0A9X3A6W9_9SPHN|nr:glycosyltransferase family 4 protein [Tsuneonella litorea]MCT2557791.1 glycosyltransferase family 4 protein [Tsuneonella litorea]